MIENEPKRRSMAVLIIDLDGVFGYWDEALNYHMHVTS
jgi:hypothetical protein